MPRNADDTRAQLIRAAERLFAERGIDGVSLREINREADQRNASALQYHFKDRLGLVEAIRRKHESRIDRTRNALLDEIERNGEADLHRFATALVHPAADKLSDRDGGRDYLLIMAQLMNAHLRRRDLVDTDLSESLNRWRSMVGPAMSPLAVDPLHSRSTARRIMFIELGRRAESRRRKDDRLFVSHLTDLVTAILDAPVSDRTRALIEERTATKA